MLKGKHISLSYPKGGQTLNDVSFELKQGRITTFMGPSGAGKTTLLKCVANLLGNYKGRIEVEEEDLQRLSPLERVQQIGVVLQQFHLFPHFTVLENCVHPLVNILKMDKERAIAEATTLLDSLGMAKYLAAYPHQLSGGQQQRVAIARALGPNPPILLLDEPSSSLDPESTKSLIGLIQELSRKGITIGISSHDMLFIRKLLDRVYFLENGAITESYDHLHDTLLEKSKIHSFLGEI